jgi:hypothetical protein
MRVMVAEVFEDQAATPFFRIGALDQRHASAKSAGYQPSARSKRGTKAGTRMGRCGGNGCINRTEEVRLFAERADSNRQPASNYRQAADRDDCSEPIPADVCEGEHFQQAAEDDHAD